MFEKYHALKKSLKKVSVTPVPLIPSSEEEKTGK